ncbi:SCO family protein [Novosphingobium sp.]|uniref:SCO family protein n=1 Tax=Novosphingobium sp. TaxID=1874826 RepID=UPI0035B496FC
MADIELEPIEAGFGEGDGGKGDGGEGGNPASLGWLLWLVAGLLLAIGALVMLGRNDSPALSETNLGGPFTLTASDGSVVTEQTFAGKPFAIYFGYTRCPDICPTSLARLARLRQKLGKDGDRFDIVFVSVDPEHDKPAAIGEYVKLFGTPIIGLTGTEAQLKQAERGYGIFVNKVPQAGGDYLIDHTAATLLVNRQGRVTEIIDHEETDASALAKLKHVIG